MTFWLVDDHGELLGRYEDRDEAVAALRRAVADESGARDEIAVVELDDNGRRVGEPILL